MADDDEVPGRDEDPTHAWIRRQMEQQQRRRWWLQRAILAVVLATAYVTYAITYVVLNPGRPIATALLLAFNATIALVSTIFFVKIELQRRRK